MTSNDNRGTDRARTPQKPPPEIDHVARIDAITRNARTTWFALLAALVFVGVTLLGVEHIDFWGVGRATALPLVGVEVPTRLFFGAAPILTAAIYCYFHIYLIRLWEALGKAPAEVDGHYLGLTVTPWLVTDAALWLRTLLRRSEDPPCLPNRSLDGPAAVLNLMVAWVFGLVVLYFSWQLSLPARSWMLSTFAAVSLCTAVMVGAASLIVMIRRMLGHGYGRPWMAMTAFTMLLVGTAGVTGVFTYLRTEGPIEWLAKLSLVDAEIVLRPDGWTERSFAEKDFRAVWCRREGINPCELGDRAQEFKAEWDARRRVAITDLEKPKFHDLTVVELEEAVDEAMGAYGGIGLSNEERREIREGVVERFWPRGANLQGADLRGAFLSGSELSGARLAQARLDGTRLEEAKLFGANLRNVELPRAFLQDANLGVANLQDAILRGANLQNADLIDADLIDANLSLSLLTGTADRPTEVYSTNLSASTNGGGALRFVVELSTSVPVSSGWRNAFIVFERAELKELDQQVGLPCQWTAEELTDAEFFGRWRWWIELRGTRWSRFAPEGWHDVPVNPGPKGCTWSDAP